LLRRCSATSRSGSRSVGLRRSTAFRPRPGRSHPRPAATAAADSAAAAGGGSGGRACPGRSGGGQRASRRRRGRSSRRLAGGRAALGGGDGEGEGEKALAERARLRPRSVPAGAAPVAAAPRLPRLLSNPRAVIIARSRFLALRASTFHTLPASTALAFRARALIMNVILLRPLLRSSYAAPASITGGARCDRSD
jgi:hypothetical protein